MNDWIKEQRPGPFILNRNQPTSNVFIADFIELENFQFCYTVIALNAKIFKELRKSIECNDIDKNDDETNQSKTCEDKERNESNSNTIEL